MKIIILKNKPELIVSSISGFLLSIPLAGFLHGFFTAIGNGSFFEDIKGRLIIGAMEAIASSITTGAPFGENEPEANTKLRIITCFVFLIITFTIYKFTTRKKNKTIKPISI
jgi:hypothetical protein